MDALSSCYGFYQDQFTENEIFNFYPKQDELTEVIHDSKSNGETSSDSYSYEDSINSFADFILQDFPQSPSLQGRVSEGKQLGQQKQEVDQLSRSCQLVQKALDRLNQATIELECELKVLRQEINLLRQNNRGMDQPHSLGPCQDQRAEDKLRTSFPKQNEFLAVTNDSCWNDDIIFDSYSCEGDINLLTGSILPDLPFEYYESMEDFPSPINPQNDAELKSPVVNTSDESQSSYTETQEMPSKKRKLDKPESSPPKKFKGSHESDQSKQISKQERRRNANKIYARKSRKQKKDAKEQLVEKISKLEIKILDLCVEHKIDYTTVLGFYKKSYVSSEECLLNIKKLEDEELKELNTLEITQSTKKNKKRGIVKNKYSARKGRLLAKDELNYLQNKLNFLQGKIEEFASNYLKIDQTFKNL